MPTDCPVCGTPAATDAARHCHECGAPLEPSASDASATGPPPPPPGAQPQGQPAYRPAQHPSGLSSETRNWAMAAHLSALVAGLATGGALTFLGPLIVWLAKREEHPFIDEHGRESLNFAISVSIFIVVSYLLMLVLIGFVLWVAVAIVALVFMIMATVRAANGESYRYPLTIRFVS